MTYDARRIAWLRKNGQRYRADLLNAESLDLVETVFIFAVHGEEAMENAKEVFSLQYGTLYDWNGVGLTIKISGPI